MDNLNTHLPSSFYETRSFTERLDTHYTPKHGGRLNIAECELSVLGRHVLIVKDPASDSLEVLSGHVRYRLLYVSVLVLSEAVLVLVLDLPDLSRRTPSNGRDRELVDV